MKKKLLKEWFPEKESLIALEQLARRQVQIYPDAADHGLMFTTQIDVEIKKHLNTLKDFYGGKSDGDGDARSGWAKFTLFIPIESSDYKPGAYDGTQVSVSLIRDITLGKRYGKQTDKFYSIDINHVTGITPEEAKKRYNSKAFDETESMTKLSEIIKEEVQGFVKSLSPVTEQSSNNSFLAPVDIDMDTSAMIRWGIATSSEDANTISIVRNQKVNLKWYVEFEYRKYGIKSIMPFVSDQTISISFERDSEDGYKEFSKDIEIRNAKVTIDSPSEMYSSVSLYPHTIEINDDEVEVHFDI